MAQVANMSLAFPVFILAMALASPAVGLQQFGAGSVYNDAYFARVAVTLA
jgi:hypothetical protein